MNYRHAYHAGNHGDVLKHIVLARVIAYMTGKAKPLLFLDAHAGIGHYGLDGEEAGKTREWQAGIGRVFGLLQDEPLMRAVAALNPAGGFMRYPGSPEIARALFRPQDRLVLNELHPEDHATLAARFGADPRATVTRQDAGAVIKAYLPPPERRGVVLIDPPYENPGEAETVVKTVREGLKRFATGTFIVWYPVVTEDLTGRLMAGLGAGLRAELRLRAIQPQGGLVGSGVFVINPPWTLDDGLRPILTELLKNLAPGPDARLVLARQESSDQSPV